MTSGYFPQRFAAAFLAISDRRSGVMDAARAAPATHRLRGLVLAVVLRRHLVFGLARQHPHNVDGVLTTSAGRLAPAGVLGIGRSILYHAEPELSALARRGGKLIRELEDGGLNRRI